MSETWLLILPALLIALGLWNLFREPPVPDWVENSMRQPAGNLLLKLIADGTLKIERRFPEVDPADDLGAGI